MKRKTLLWVLAAVCVVFCMLSFAACNVNPEHSHSYKWVDNNDGTHKQHCSVEGCDQPDINLGSHDFTNGNCICGKEKPTEPAPQHKHEYKWVDNDDGTHKQHCSVEGCDNPDINIGSHDFANGNCICGKEQPIHNHVFNMETATEPYLKSSADCMHKAQYYYSCECGEKGTDTFEYGDFGQHSQFGNWQQEVPASHTASGVKGHKDCLICNKHFDESGAEITDLVIPQIKHKFDKRVAEEQYLVSAATCTQKAVYYFSCECGENGTDTFEYGEPHTYGDDNLCTVCHIHKPSSGLKFSITGDTASVTGIGSCRDTEIYIPSTYQDKPVTSIASSAFYNCGSLTQITIPDSVTSIGSGAFSACRYVTKIVVPESVTSIGKNAFLACNELVDVTIPENVTVIESMVFCACTKLKSITIPEGVVSIGDDAFATCRSLTQITVPKGVQSIGIRAFQGCSALTSISLPFAGATADATGSTLFAYVFGTTDYQRSNEYVPSTLKTVVIDGGIIGDYAFALCSNITSITLGDNVTSIGTSAFWNCTALTKLTLGDNVADIGASAFAGCNSLQYTTVNNTSYGYNVMYLESKSNPTFVAVKATDTNITDCKISSDTKIIYGFAFNGCKNLTNIEIPEGVTMIKSGAFQYCSGLTSITIPQSVTILGDFVFSNCGKLTTINFNGTQPQWKAIIKGDKWNIGTGNYTVKCSDGTLSKAQST
ncbi:MAG: leucine-rich repeat domain-containing protein [Corallococcus sp.]|nr:leucine-rich repeat domain-containing protein [Corallococcus sp.]